MARRVARRTGMAVVALASAVILLVSGVYSLSVEATPNHGWGKP